MSRDVSQVAQDHLDAVRSGDPDAMAADYAPDAVIERAGDVHVGREAILTYFRGVPARLGAATVEFDQLVVDGETATFRWHIEGAGKPVSGTDVCTVIDGFIVRQVVNLHAADF